MKTYAIMDRDGQRFIVEAERATIAENGMLTLSIGEGEDKEIAGVFQGFLSFAEEHTIQAPPEPVSVEQPLPTMPDEETAVPPEE